MISLVSISHRYNPGSRVLDFSNWEVFSGERWLISGLSGSGKSTLLMIIAGLLRPSSGNLFIEDTDIYTLPEYKRDLFRGSKIGFVFQKPYFFNHLTVEENLLAAQYFSGNKTGQNPLQSMLRKLNLEEFRNYFPHNLSFGQQQRLAVARALINEPLIIIADEPTSGLDDEHFKLVADLLFSEAEESNSILLTASHDYRLKKYFNQVYTLNI